MSRRTIIVVLVLALAAWGVFKIVRVMMLVESIRADAQSLNALTENGSFAVWQNSPALLTARMLSLKTDLHDLNSEIGLAAYLGPLFGWLPNYGGEVSQAAALLEFGDSMAAGGHTTLAMFEAISTEVDSGRGAGKPIGVAALSALERHSSGIEKARLELVRARRARSALDVTRLGRTSRDLVERLDRLFPLWSTAISALALAPNLLGSKGPQEFILLVQNSDELRPTGGFISSVVRIRMDKGDIAELDFRDSYAVDNPNVTHPAPPGPLKKYMQAEYWTIRDANWSADFPTTARDVLRLYQLDQGRSPAGVIASNLGIVANLLQTLGPIEVEGTGQQVNAGNALAVMQSYWDSPQGQGHSADWWFHRKDFTGKLLVTMLEHIRNGQFDKTQFVHLLAQAIASKDLLFFFTDPKSQALVDSAGWAGGLPAFEGDLLMIVDSNLGFNKVDPKVVRHADYAIQIDEAGNGTALLTLSYQNTSVADNTSCSHVLAYPPTYAEMQQGCYWDYIRVVSATGARFLSSSPGVDSGADDPVNGHPVFHEFVTVPRAAAQQVQFNYQLPRVVSHGGTYRLHVQKQPGAPIWSLEVKVTLPSTEAVRSDPAPKTINGHTLEYDLILDQDRDIVIERPSPFLSGLALSVVAAASSLGLLGIWLLRRRPGLLATRGGAVARILRSGLRR